MHLSHWINNAEAHQSTPHIFVTNPATNTPLCTLPLATPEIVSTAIEKSHAAFLAWSGLTLKSRSMILSKFHELVVRDKAQIVECIVKENGKTAGEAAGEVDKGLETVLYAVGIPAIGGGDRMEVSR